MKYKIPMVDLYRQYTTIRTEIDDAIKIVITESSFIGGSRIRILEEEIAAYCESKYAVALNSGTDALELSLRAIGIKQGDEVITSPYTFFATAETIAYLGAKPIFVDIDTTSFNINVDLIEEKITKKTKALIPVHLFGQSSDTSRIMKLARKYKLYVIEDACQALGSTYKGKKVGGIGTTGCFSFFPSKNLGAYGDGGILVTNNKKIEDYVRVYRNHGSKIKYYNETIGTSSRLDGIQAAILLAKLKHLDKWNEKRRKIAEKYIQLLKHIPEIAVPIEKKYNFHIYHQFPIQVKKNRNSLKTFLEKNGIASMIYYPIPLHLLKALKYLGHKTGDFPNAEKSSKEILCLPIFPELTDKEIEYVANCIKRFYF